MARYETDGVWQPNPVTFPDTLTLAILNIRTPLAPARVSASLVGWKRPEPCVQLHRVGGNATGIFDNCELQVDVRDETLDKVQALTTATRQALTNLPNLVSEVKRVTETGSVKWLPDPEDDQPRMTWDVLIKVIGQ